MSDEAKPEAAAPSPPPAPQPERAKIAATLKAPAPLFACRFDPSGRFLLGGGQDFAISRFDLEAPDKPPALLKGHESWVRGLAFDPKGQFLVSGGYDGRLVWWPLADAEPQPLRSVQAHQGWIRAVATSPDGRLVASCGNDRTVKVWDLSEGKLLRVLESKEAGGAHDCHVYNVLFHPRGEELVSADLKGVLRRWKLADGALLGQLDGGALYKYDGGFRADIGGARGMAFSQDGAQLAVSGMTEVSNAFAGVGKALVLVFDLAAGKLLLRQDPKGKELQGVVWSVVLHPGGFTAALSSGQGGCWILFWRAGEAEDFHRLQLPAHGFDLALHPDGRRLATAHHDGKLRLVELS